MVNVLFISNTARINIIKSALQPLLKVKIDVVGDFDYGLKDVFEKRPALVFIQDQIAGVTGESVARHIQMLLGNGSPTFIFMHDGNSKAKPIHGLYEYLIDLSQADQKVVSDIQEALKSLLGLQWHKIYLPPKKPMPGVRTALAVPDEDRVVADQLVDDFISDLQNVGSAPVAASNPLADFSAPDVSPDEPFQIVSSPHDQLAEILSRGANHRHVPAPASPADGDISEVSSLTTTTVVQNRLSGTSQDSVEPFAPDATAVSERPQPVMKNPASTKQDVHTAKEAAAAPVPPRGSGSAQAPLISPADFRIEREHVTRETAPEDALRAFEIDYRAKSVRRKWYQGVAVAVLLCLTAGGWLLIRQNPRPVWSVTKGSTPPAVPASPSKPAATAAAVQKVVSTTHQPDKTVLPSFIPLSGLDPEYALKKPGWERYVGTESEFRIFRSGGKLKAVQAVAPKNGTISDSMLTSMLTEIAGDGQYLVTRREQKHGFQVLHARVARKADLLMYRKKSAVQAVVISLD